MDAMAMDSNFFLFISLFNVSSQNLTHKFNF
jgi:hypothetical protein